MGENGYRHLVAVYPGTFDPVHRGHLDIAKRAARLRLTITTFGKLSLQVSAAYRFSLSGVAILSSVGLRTSPGMV